jgi:DNA-directed RNA polymerase subunit RPC12/RpoP
MAIVDLSKIILSKTILGITCPRCGGELIPLEKKGRSKWWNSIQVWLEKEKNVHQYHCIACQARFKMSHTSSL